MRFSLFRHPSFFPTIFFIGGFALIMGSISIWQMKAGDFSFSSSLIVLGLVSVIALWGIQSRLLELTQKKSHLAWLSKNFPPFFFALSLFSLVVIFSHDLWRILYALGVGMMIAGMIHWALRDVSSSKSWRQLLWFFVFLFVIVFLTIVLTQNYAANFIFENRSIANTHIPFFRSFLLAGFWLGTWILSQLLTPFLPRKIHHLFWILWGIGWSVYLLFWAINLGLLYYSGLFLNPIALDHFDGSKEVLINQMSVLLIGSWIVLSTLCFYLLFRLHRTEKSLPHRPQQFLFFSLFLIAASTFFSFVNFLSSLPEYRVARQFAGPSVTVVDLPEDLQTKLSRFGLNYDPEKFFVAQKEKIYQNNIPGVSEKFQKNSPNVLIVFWESFSSDLSDVYNPELPGITPGLIKMANNPNTTVVHNSMNASTPTITGILSQICSFLPPTGHEEIATQQRITRLNLTCLPKLLKDRGYETTYVTAVEKNYANKDQLFESAGVEKTLGKEELKKYISQKPLSWGFSDHQTFPVIQQLMEESTKPFLMMHSTVDTHPPYTLPKDMVKYEDGKNDLLNSFHTTDDAFRSFWSWFEKSEFASNTIVLVIGDHALFPSEPVQKILGKKKWVTFYDELAHLWYVPDSSLPRKIDFLSSSIDIAPTLSQLLGINEPNAFDGHSLFDDRKEFPRILGMHEFGLYINEPKENGTWSIQYGAPAHLECPQELSIDPQSPLTLCEFLRFYQWKKFMLEQGRLGSP